MKKLKTIELSHEVNRRIYNFNILAILPATDIQAMTTTKGKIEVQWKRPSVEITLDVSQPTFGTLMPDGYAVLYRPTAAENFASAATGDRMISLEDVRLGATYIIQLRCLYKDTAISCGSKEIEACELLLYDFSVLNYTVNLRFEIHEAISDLNIIAKKISAITLFCFCIGRQTKI